MIQHETAATFWCPLCKAYRVPVENTHVSGAESAVRCGGCDHLIVIPQRRDGTGYQAQNITDLSTK